ncbi:hypothetical protein RF11_10678 [Thelohanellus kitauei]|uniref:Uncharacterized protein n=1 Tax=Thelohanellus kitauei TaxID=669202 RepID=A0A0C2IVB7_THEKT|nr:hypothetical protein RF11_10678 [Thelohanellus kitauei]
MFDLFKATTIKPSTITPSVSTEYEEVSTEPSDDTSTEYDDRKEFSHGSNSNVKGHVFMGFVILLFIAVYVIKNKNHLFRGERIRLFHASARYSKINGVEEDDMTLNFR